MSLEEQLRALKSSTSDKNLLSHIQSIFSHLLTSRYLFLISPSSDLFQQFEDISLYMKTSSGPKVNFIREHYSELKEYLDKIRPLLIKQTQEGEEVQEAGPIGYVPNFLEESKKFQQAGFYFGEEESFVLFKSMTKLAQIRNTKQLRLWGKILCSQKDYYIVETIVDSGEEQELPPNAEPRGTGANKFTYFATNDWDWTELPLVIPEHIIKARQIKYLFTGNLNKKIITNPHFPGQERHLLRTQIARISQSTQICPAGIYKLNEEDPKQIELIEQDENYKPPTYEHYTNLSNWCYLAESLLKEGRIQHMKPEIPEGEEEETYMKKIEANDPFEPRLKKLDNINWILKLIGDNSNYLSQDGKKILNNGGVVLKSQVWQGYVILFQDKIQQSLYVGYGFKTDSKLFYPKVPQMMQEEPEDKVDQHEPREPYTEQQQEIKQDEDS